MLGNLDKNSLYVAGVELTKRFCQHNDIQLPNLERINRNDRRYGLGTCAYYRPFTIHVMVEKCASCGFAGRQWSWPGYTVDRTPYGVIQHELGHHLDELRTQNGRLFSQMVHAESNEEPLTGYLGTDRREGTLHKEWFAEIFRLFVTNPGLCELLRPKFFKAMQSTGCKPLAMGNWREALVSNSAPARTLFQAERKITMQASAQRQVQDHLSASNLELPL